jgi:tetratricopeptide (TPR) repeat protein
MKLFEALPRELQEQPSLLCMYISAAADVDERKYERALARYLQLNPNDPSSNVMAIDCYFLRKRWAEVEKAISVVEARVGKDDGWFEVLRAGASHTQGKVDDAKTHFMNAIAREKTLKDPYFNLINLALAEKHRDAVAKWLEAVERDAHIELQDVSTVPQYADFAASKEGKAFVKRWRAAQAKREK